MMDHQKQWQLLRKAVELGKIPHALLFYGGDSTDKKTLALEFIKLLNCRDEDFKSRPCQKCRSCRDFEKRVHPDLFIIEPQDNKEIKISQIRELRSKLSLRAFSAPFKSALIDQAHCLNQEAQSAFLKLLEEPKGKTIFILITDYPEMLLPTVLSRVERLRFYSPLKSQIGDYQKKIIAELSEISHQNLASRFQYAKKLSEDPQNLKEILNIWLRCFREALISRLRQPASPKPQRGEGSGGQAKDYSLAKLQKILKTIQSTNFLISTTNVNPRLALEILMLEL